MEGGVGGRWGFLKMDGTQWERVRGLSEGSRELQESSLPLLFGDI